MKSGVYKITVGTKVYFGRTGNFSQRKSKHKCSLRKGNHCNPILQNSFNKYGDFLFEIIEQIEGLQLQIVREQWYIDNIPNCNINSATIGGFKGQIPWNKGMKTKLKPRLGVEVSKETRSRMAAAQKGNINKRDKKLSKESKLKIGLACRGRKPYNKDETVYVWLKDGTLTHVSTIERLCSSFELNRKVLKAVVRGSKRSYRGFKCIACVINTPKDTL